jgi:hypothetical protein
LRQAYGGFVCPPHALRHGPSLCNVGSKLRADNSARPPWRSRSDDCQRTPGWIRRGTSAGLVRSGRPIRGDRDLPRCGVERRSAFGPFGGCFVPDRERSAGTGGGATARPRSQPPEGASRAEAGSLTDPRSPQRARCGRNSSPPTASRAEAGPLTFPADPRSRASTPQMAQAARRALPQGPRKVDLRSAEAAMKRARFCGSDTRAQGRLADLGLDHSAHRRHGVERFVAFGEREKDPVEQSSDVLGEPRVMHEVSQIVRAVIHRPAASTSNGRDFHRIADNTRPFWRSPPAGALPLSGSCHSNLAQPLLTSVEQRTTASRPVMTPQELQ